jgi:TPR repeat protein
VTARFSRGWAIAIVALAPIACAHRAVDLTPLASAPPVCPLDGCGGRAAARPAAHATVFCAGSGAAACGGAPATECADRARAAWADAQDARAMACVAGMFTDACSMGEPRACTFAGRLWIDGRGVERDAERGINMLIRACDEGSAAACAFAGHWLAEPSNTRDLPGASELHHRVDVEAACLAGQSDQCFLAGHAFFGALDGFPQDRALAAKAYERGCDLGESAACNNLGDALAYGDGVPRDVERAASLFERACHLGCPLGCSALGYMAEHGLGAQRDKARARALYQDACIAFEPYGCLHSEMLAAVESGAPRDAERALAQWERACERGRDARACAFLGLLYQDGPDSLSRDEAKSDQAMSRSCELGYRRACDWMKQFHSED